ncbi:iron ABC transporter permease [Hyphomicrobium sp.]|uniref:ABC transporter permease n=1 Tax=Hyphomicrobium sp. TaxID=82 RepID=UPI0025C0F641|nr:iron ABC transporter permease [Hyphomicrobium sp.]MCC7251597.1 iron ABC transporter permease [Hyphomicrobium sp.]
MSLTPPTSADPQRGALESLRRAFSAWRASSHAPGWSFTAALVLAVIALPIAAVLYLAATANANDWPHLVSSVLPIALQNTLLLVLGTGLVTLVVGTGTAWLVTMYRFPGRAVLDRLLVLPLAIPTYIAAYCYGELFDYAGPVQTGLRSLFGWTVADYWFPDIRSLGGATLVMSAVVYPYVYLAARATFVQQSVCALEVARTLGRTSMGTFWAVALPLARPALAAGAALVAMETLNDLGAVQHLGVETLSASIYATWLQRSNLGGAAQLATVMLVLIVLLLAAERIARGGAKIHHTTGRYRAIPFQDIEGWRGYGAAFLCSLPFIVGFMVPFLLLARFAVRHISVAIEGGFLRAAWNSLFLATLAALVAVALGLLLSYAPRVAKTGFTRFAAQMSGFGYALPGAVLALGVLIPLAALDNSVDALARDLLGVSTGLILSGSVAALVYAYVIRFLAVARGGIEAGLERISPNLDAAARALGETAASALWRIHLPLLAPALGVAGLLVFVDALKELPATLLLRPFNFETLATHVYAFAALEQIESGALGALSIVLAGLVPLVVLHRAIAGRAGDSGA